MTATLRLNATGDRILVRDDSDCGPFSGLSTNSQNPQEKEKKGQKKKEKGYCYFINQKVTFLFGGIGDISIWR